MEFKTERFTIRKWKYEDASYLIKHANNKKIADQLRDGFPYPYTLEEAKKWLTNISKMENNYFFAIDIDGEPVGGIGLGLKDDVYRKSAEIGYWLSEDYWNKGIMTEAVQILTNYAIEKLRMLRVFAGIFETNKASMKVLEKAGYHLEAIHKNAVIKNRQVMDEYIYAFLK
jgi:RimJ/RimL family protein N-acetyltransferase